MTEIIVCIVLIFVFLIIAFICFLSGEHIAALSSTIITLIMFIILCHAVKAYESEKITEDTISGVIYDITDFQIDTNLVVTDTDTTKTYTITYYK